LGIWGFEIGDSVALAIAINPISKTQSQSQS
jgi:hypothetical protein